MGDDPFLKTAFYAVIVFLAYLLSVVGRFFKRKEK